VALGSDQRVAWEGREDVLTLIQELQQQGRCVVALDNIERATILEQVKQAVGEKPLVCIAGNEVEGLEPAVLDACEYVAMIAMPGAKQSLNVSVAAGIAMFALTQKNG
jgi:tRNA G18 (ribose-2'-O)-methylase SpoU